MSTLTKCTKFPLSYIEPPEISYKEFCQMYFDISRQIRTVKNLVSTDFWLQKTQDAAIHEETGEWPKFSKQKWANEEYHKYKSMMPMYQTSHVSQLMQSEVKTLSSHWKEVLRGDRTIDSYKSGQPVVLKGDTIRFEFVGSECLAVISLFSTEIKKQFPVKNGMIRFKAYLKSGSLKAIAERCANGEYKICASTLDYDKGKKQFGLSLTYSFEKEQETALDPEKIVGIDLGITNAYYAATNFSEDRFYDPGGDIEAFRQKTEALRWKKKKQRAVCGNGSIGHGYKKRMKPVTDIADKIARYRAHKNHLMARKIVDEAVRMKCGTIQMEDLSGISSNSLFLKNWSYYDLQQKIEQKAAESGVVVRKIDPQYTSQRCCRFGHIDYMNRPKDSGNWQKFKCTSCGFEANADYNAARNIATAGIENLIKEAIANSK